MAADQTPAEPRRLPPGGAGTPWLVVLTLISVLALALAIVALAD